MSASTEQTETSEPCAQLLGFLYHELSVTEEFAFHRHMERCAGCRAEAEALGRVRAAVKDIWIEPPPPTEAGRMQLLEAAKRPKRTGILSLLRRVTMHPGYAMAASVVLVGGVLGYEWSQGRKVAFEPIAPAASESPTVVQQESPSSPSAVGGVVGKRETDALEHEVQVLRRASRALGANTDRIATAAIKRLGFKKSEEPANSPKSAGPPPPPPLPESAEEPALAASAPDIVQQAPPSNEIKEHEARVAPSAAGHTQSTIRQRAELLAKQGHCDEALRLFQQAQSELPTNEWSTSERATFADCLRIAGRVQEAQHVLQRNKNGPSRAAKQQPNPEIKTNSDDHVAP